MSVTDLSGGLARDLPTELVGNTVVDYGDLALMVQCGSTAEVLAWADALRRAEIPGVVDVVPAARTVLVKLHDARRQGVIRQRLRKMGVAATGTADSERRADVVIDVVYDGPDLAEVAAHAGLTIPAVIDAHTATPWRVGFNGFAPGFAYLVDGDPRLRVPRRPEPRTSVPDGSVGLAGEFSAVYPRPSPGGWQLIGRTEAVLWDLQRPSPALLTQGVWVQFRAV
ncbi:allophanate hydrolase [Mycobacterium mantenii]|uniref:Allophanate hydrolase n=1 Tax=Mycobacterium mantenii TaxID=560555 RepID=A0A1X0FP66_MYCNT|nr:allophanate hydrolase subunit 1 [Mycobacterium mantenii]MCV7242471.1 allophanate hydrolase subunit 1 [Mycobacterium mantenii]ORB03587.1 allophanate hydrolase [Mycobacterium mantenii]BBY39491.1 allophanate hydrolase [Mycobacterium mantenii]